MNGFIEMMKAEGLHVWMRNPNKDTWAYVTDGKNMAYMQWGDRPGVSTVHVPNRTTGTGFQFADSINPKLVRDAMNCHAPTWAKSREWESVRKYADWDDFLNASSFNKQYREV